MCEAVLLHSRVDHRIAVVVEQAEPAVQPHIDRGGLEHLWIIGFEDDTGGVELGADVAIGEEHGSIVPCA